MVSSVSFRRRHLPHWMVADASYFVTVREKGTLPKHVVEQLRQEREDLSRRGHSLEQETELRRRQFRMMEDILDGVTIQGGSVIRPETAPIVMSSFDWLERELSWRIYAMVLMPNHVHILLRNLEGRNSLLSTDLGRVKRFTGTRINAVLERQGSFWQDENFDHWCRTPEEFDRVRHYILENPVRAGLVRSIDDWPWKMIRDEDK